MPELKKPTKLVIDCDKWLRGDDGASSTLLNAEGHMCCLGFYCLAAGLGEADITHADVPADVNIEVSIPALTRVGKHTEFCEAAMRINDTAEFTDAHRIKELTALFKEEGIDVKFINQPSEARAQVAEET